MDGPKSCQIWRRRRHYYGTNTYEYHLFTLLGSDSFQNGLPMVWAILQRQMHVDLVEVLKSIKTCAEAMICVSGQDTPTPWNPSCFIVDDSKEEQSAITEVFLGVPIHLCIWHVHKVWLRQLHQRVKCPITKADMNRDLGQIMYTRYLNPQEVSMSFIHKYTDSEPHFVKYYSACWHPKLLQWAKAFRSEARSRQDIDCCN